MKPLVTAVVADATGTMEATFFNQPWLQRKYAPGTRLLLSGKYQARNRFRVQFHAESGEEVGADDDMATYPATDGLSTTQILALVRQWRGAAQEIAGAAARAAAGDRAAARPRARRSTPRTSATRRAAAAGWPSRSCCWCRSRCCAAARAGARAPGPSRWSRRAS